MFSILLGKHERPKRLVNSEISSRKELTAHHLRNLGLLSGVLALVPETIDPEEMSRRVQKMSKWPRGAQIAVHTTDLVTLTSPRRTTIIQEFTDRGYDVVDQSMYGFLEVDEVGNLVDRAALNQQDTKLDGRVLVLPEDIDGLEQYGGKPFMPRILVAVSQPPSESVDDIVRLGWRQAV